MKVYVCDVCKYQEKKLVAATYKLSKKSSVTQEKISLDACGQHQEFLKGCATMDEARERVYKLHGM